MRSVGLIPFWLHVGGRAPYADFISCTLVAVNFRFYATDEFGGVAGCSWSSFLQWRALLFVINSSSASFTSSFNRIFATLSVLCHLLTPQLLRSLTFVTKRENVLASSNLFAPLFRKISQIAFRQSSLI